jgi:hypothetical protein
MNQRAPDLKVRSIALPEPEKEKGENTVNQ